MVKVGGVSVFHLKIGVESIERVIFILDKLARILEVRGILLSSCEYGFNAWKLNGKISLKFQEEFEKIKYHPTPEERRRQTEIDFLRRRHPGIQLDDAFPPLTERPLGELSISIEAPEPKSGSRRQWRDNKSASLEAQADEMARYLADWLDELCAKTFVAKRPERISQRRERNHSLASLRAERETKRGAFLAEVAERGLTADRIRAWIAAVGEPEEVETQRLLAWARTELAWLEGTFHPKRFAAEIRRRELFPDEDPLAPLPHDPDAESGT